MAGPLLPNSSWELGSLGRNSFGANFAGWALLTARCCSRAFCDAPRAVLEEFLLLLPAVHSQNGGSSCGSSGGPSRAPPAHAVAGPAADNHGPEGLESGDEAVRLHLKGAPEGNLHVVLRGHLSLPPESESDSACLGVTQQPSLPGANSGI